MHEKPRLWTLLIGIFLFLTVTEVFAVQERHALIIGNADYDKSIGALKNPGNDAASMTRSLQQKGFDVTFLKNAGKRQMEQEFRAFARKLRTDAVGLFFFAGHAIEVDGENYLIPIGAHIEDEVDAKYEAVSVARLLDNMDSAGNGLNLVILDACRNNPFSRRFRSASRGLRMMSPPSGTMILYATEPGNVAADGEGNNGVFTHHLLRSIEKSGLSVEEAFKQTALAVKQETRGKQIPWYEGIILGQFSFVPSRQVSVVQQSPTPVAALPSAVVTTQSQEIVFWQSVESRPTLAGYEAYLATYPGGVFSALAQARVSELSKKSVHQKAPKVVMQETAVKKQETRIARADPYPHKKKQLVKSSRALPRRMENLGSGNQLVFLKDVRLDEKGKVIFRKGETTEHRSTWEWDCVFSGRPGETIKDGTAFTISDVQDHSITVSGGDEESTVKIDLQESTYGMRCYTSFRQSTSTRMKTSEFRATVGKHLALE